MSIDLISNLQRASSLSQTHYNLFRNYSCVRYYPRSIKSLFTCENLASSSFWSTRVNFEEQLSHRVSPTRGPHAVLYGKRFQRQTRSAYNTDSWVQSKPKYHHRPIASSDSIWRKSANRITRERWPLMATSPISLMQSSMSSGSGIAKLK